MATTTTEAPTRKLVLPSPEEAPLPSNMPDVMTLTKWQRFVDNKTEFRLKNKDAGKVVGSDAAMLLNFVPDHLFPMHDVPTNRVEYQYNVAMLVPRDEKTKNLPLPTFLCPVKDFFELFVPA